MGCDKRPKVGRCRLTEPLRVLHQSSTVQCQEEQFAYAFRSLETNSACSEAVVTLHDGSRLFFIHAVEKQQTLAVGPEGQELKHGSAAKLLNNIKIFRLNSNHLEMWFQDDSRWEMKPVPGCSVSHRGG